MTRFASLPAAARMGAAILIAAALFGVAGLTSPLRVGRPAPVATMAPAQAPAAGDWPTYGYDAGSTRHSPLTQISLSNVAKLTRAWTYHTYVEPPQSATAPAAAPAGGRGGGRGGGGNGRRASEATPIVAAGIMYLPTPYGRVVALDPETGKEIWVHESTAGAVTMRGVEYFPGDAITPPSIVFSAGRNLVVLEQDGKPIPRLARTE